MTPPSTTKRKLSTADERRATLIAAALPVFAEHGYHAAPTAEIARAAGISQAYVFRLFPTKAELFAAVCEVTRERMLTTFRDAAVRARGAGVDPLAVMGQAYNDLLDRDRDVLLLQLHAQAAAGREPLIRDSMRRTFRDLYSLIARESGAGPEQLGLFFAHGMLCNVMAALDADGIDEEWAHTLAGSDVLQEA